MNRVAVRPEMLRWARERSGRSEDYLRKKFPKLQEWEQGELHPTLKQLESFANATYVPTGYFFLEQPPVETIPIPDLRTIASRGVMRPSPNLLDTIYICLRRQDWYRDFVRSTGEGGVDFVGSARDTTSTEQLAEDMRRELDFSLEDRAECPTWTEALRQFIDRADAIGVLVMASGVVGSNTRRKLDPDEFRGFAMADDLAPLVFINGADTKAAQMFTLAHELAHLWLGESALSDVGPNSAPTNSVERRCNEIAAEFLVPLDTLMEVLPAADPINKKQQLAKRFKVSTLVILRRLRDADAITAPEFHDAYKEELDFLLSQPRGSGGDFYLTQAARVSKRFARALITSTLEGQTLYRDAFRLLGVKKQATFDDFCERLGIPA